jgi:hypothetical protein
MVVDDFDMIRPSFGPDETDAPLIVDADRVLATPVSSERFQPVCRRRAQIAKIARLMKHIKLSQSLLLDSAETLHVRAHPETVCRAVAKRSDHVSI